MVIPAAVRRSPALTLPIVDERGEQSNPDRPTISPDVLDGYAFEDSGTNSNRTPRLRTPKTFRKRSN